MRGRETERETPTAGIGRHSGGLGFRVYVCLGMGSYCKVWRGYECTYAMSTHTYGRVGAGLGLLLDFIEQGHDQLSPVLTWFCGGFLCSPPPVSVVASLLAGFFLCEDTHTNTTNYHTHKPHVCVCVCVCVRARVRVRVCVLCVVCFSLQH